ncbi:hypothetical protein ACHAP8_011417 [Fusarium lateritium]
MTSALEHYRTVKAAWTEGRLENVLQRQKELSLLHTNIKKSYSDLIGAISQDLQISDASAADELQLALDSITTLYDSLDFPSTLAKEKLVGKGASSLDNLVSLGITLIDPSPYSPFASILAPLSATVAAGGAAIVLASSKTPSLNNELRSLITKSLDFEAFAITDDDSATTRHQLGSQHFGVAVLQNLSERDALFTSLYKVNPLIKLLSPPSGTPASFVDRSAQNLEAVSSYLIHAGPKAPRRNRLRIPRVVFVDEIHVEQLDKLIHADPSANAPLSFGRDQDKAQAFDKLLHSKFPSSMGKLSTKGGGLPAVITLADSNEIVADDMEEVVELLEDSTNGLLLVSTRSLDHGIDIFNKINTNKPSQAVYIFASSKASSYVALFTNTLQVFINTIPQWSLGNLVHKVTVKYQGLTALLFTAAIAPSTPSVADRLLYRREDFSVNKPILQESLKPSQALAAGAKSVWPFLSQTLQLGKIKQHKGGRLSYFERGLIVGLALSLFAISGTGFGIRRMLIS